MGNVLDKNVEKIKTQILCRIISENSTIYEIMSKNMVETEATIDVT
jgi:hypothetical protein